MTKIIDISVPLSPDLPVWPGDQKVVINKQYDMQNGDAANLTSLHISSHTGTHIDAPLHFVNGGKTTADIPLGKLIGECQVVDCQGLKQIDAAFLQKLSLPDYTHKLLFKTDNSKLWENPKHPFFKEYCALTPDAAEWVVANQIHLVGIDYASIELFTGSGETHVVLLSGEVVILENLDLRFVEPGRYKLICLPLKIDGVEGTVARAVLEK